MKKNRRWLFPFIKKNKKDPAKDPGIAPAAAGGSGDYPAGRAEEPPILCVYAGPDYFRKRSGDRGENREGPEKEDIAEEPKKVDAAAEPAEEENTAETAEDLPEQPDPAPMSGVYAAPRMPPQNRFGLPEPPVSLVYAAPAYMLHKGGVKAAVDSIKKQDAGRDRIASCPNCGFIPEKPSKFCPDCGEPMPAPEAPGRTEEI